MLTLKKNSLISGALGAVLAVGRCKRFGAKSGTYTEHTPTRRDASPRLRNAESQHAAGHSASPAKGTSWNSTAAAASTAGKSYGSRNAAGTVHAGYPNCRTDP